MGDNIKGEEKSFGSSTLIEVSILKKGLSVM